MDKQKSEMLVDMLWESGAPGMALEPDVRKQAIAAAMAGDDERMTILLATAAGCPDVPPLA